MKNELPLVSIIVPCYNHEKFITECINSIVNQTYNNIQLIVIDDGSTDNSIFILNKLKKVYDFVFISQKNIGLSATLNKAIKEIAKGTYITICASDDFWCLDKIEKQVFFMEKNTDYPMCYGRTYYVDLNSNLIENYKRSDNRLRGGDIFEDLFLFKFHPPVNYLFRRSIYDEIGYYDANIYAEDYYMNLKISSKYPIGFINDYLGFYRVDDNSNKIIRFEKVSNSHLSSIQEYKRHKKYKTAKQMVYLRKFYVFSGYAKHKKIAAINLFKSVGLFYNKKFIVGMLKMLLLWK